MGDLQVIFLLLLAKLLLIGGECEGQKESKNYVEMPKQSGQIPTDSDELAKPSNPGQVLTISGQMTKQSGKVPKKSGQMPTNSGQMVEKHSGKAPNDASYSWLENHWQKMFGKEYHGQLNKFIEGINKKQCLLEAVFYQQNSAEVN
ncbi:hypothetical protein niasHT_018629 [Heterodera trifolii]|uniref:Uncharacterized protein n=1 Tax=Heterodera trifolii TaxID=157864 RepID=A0ABD2KZE6_9BILA